MTVRAGTLCLSGIVVTTTAERLPEVEAALTALPGAEVRYADATTARLVVVQEAHTIDDEIVGMQRIRALPGVVDASLVFHYFDDAAAAA